MYVYHAAGWRGGDWRSTHQSKSRPSKPWSLQNLTALAMNVARLALSARVVKTVAAHRDRRGGGAKVGL